MNLTNPQPDPRLFGAFIQACIPEVARINIQLFDEFKEDKLGVDPILDWTCEHVRDEIQKDEPSPYRLGALLCVALTALVEAVGGDE